MCPCKGLIMSSLKSYPSLAHFLGTAFVARVRFCAVALLALLWVAQPANAQTPDLSGTTTPLPVTPGGDAVVVFPDLVVSDADTNPALIRIRVENTDDLNPADTPAFQGAPNTNGFQVQFFSGADLIDTTYDSLFVALASGAAGTADRWHDLLRNFTFAAPAGSGGRELRLFVQVRYTLTGSDSPDTLTRTLNIGAAPATNAPPTSTGLTATLAEDDSHTFAAAQFNFADTDTGDSLQQVRIDTLPAGTRGSLALNSTPVTVTQVIPVAGIPNLVYTPAANVNGDATFTFSVSDGTDFSTPPATATVTVTAVNDDPTGLPTISGTPRVNDTLTAQTDGISDIDGPDSLQFTYQWNRRSSGGADTAIGGADSATYTLIGDDLGKQITVSVRYTDAGGKDEGPLTSAPTAAVAMMSPPDLSGTTTPLAITPGATVVIFPDLVVRDADANPRIMRIRVENPDDLNLSDNMGFLGVPDLSEFQHRFIHPSHISSTTSDVLFIAELTGVAPPQEIWQALFRSIFFRTYVGGRELRVFVDVSYDARNFSPDRLTRTLTIGTGNTPPTTSGLTATVFENTPYTFVASEFKFADVNSDDSLVAVRIDSLPDSANGSLALGTGTSATPVNPAQVIPVADIPTLVYTPVTDTVGTATFTYSVSDGTVFSVAPATATLNIIATDHLPTSSGLTVTFFEGTSHNFGLAEFNFADMDGATLQNLRIDSLPNTGRLDVSGTAVIAGKEIAVADIPKLRYTPVANTTGTVTFTYSVSDGTHYSAAPATATLNIIAADHLPTSSGLTVTAFEGVFHTFAAAEFKFSGAGGGSDSLQAVRIDSLTDAGTLSRDLRPITSGEIFKVNQITSLIYNPAINSAGTVDTFTYSVSDGTNYSAAPATATLYIVAVGTPTTSDLTVTTAEDTPYTFAAGNFNFDDANSGDNLQQVRIDSLPASADGSLALNGTPVTAMDVIAVAAIPNLVYTPALNVNGDATFTFSISDGTAFSTAPATATVTVTPVNDAPTTGNLTATTAEDTTHTFAVADFTFNDVDGDSLAAVRIDTLPDSADGSLALGTGTSATPVNIAQVIAATAIPNLVYTPVANVNGDATFTFSVSDGTDFSATPATATVTVNPVNDPPSGLPTITGAPRVGNTLTADTSGISDADGLANATFTYRWLADGGTISGATARTLVPTSAHVGADVEVRVSFTDDAGNNERLTSQAVSIGAAVSETLSISGGGTVREGGDATFTVTLSGPSLAAAVVVDYATATGTASANDFAATSGTLTFAANSTDLIRTFTVTTTDDDLAEGSETFTATLSANTSTPLPTGFSLGTATATATIAASDAATVSISGGGTVNEGDDATFTVTLSGSPGAAVMVDYATAAGTATAGNDFTATSGSLTFAAGTPDLTQTFDVPVLTDSFVEGSESFTATLSANSTSPLPTGFTLGTATATATIGAGGTATVSIAGPTGNVNEGDDATFTVTLSGSPGAAVVVDYATAIGTASATDFSDTSGTLTFAANTTTLSQTFDVPVLDDPQVEGSETFTATLSANSSNPLPTGFSLGTATATATIGAAGTATVSIAGPTGNVNEGDDATFTVTLSGSPGAAVVVDYATAIGTASATDFSDTSGTLTFAANTTTLSQTFDVPVLDDPQVEGSETFTATLSANSSNPLPTGFTLGTATATATIGAAGTATVSIAGPTGNVNEGDDATFTVTLSGSPGAAVVVDYATAIGTASATDFSDTSGTLTFAANTTTLSQTFDVPVLDDPQVEGSETFTATLSANSSNPLPTGFSLGTATATATIGAAGTATVSIAGPTGNVNEGDDATFTVTLSGSPGAAVVVDYATAIGTASATDFSDTSGTLTFAANTTTLSQTFDVPVLDDPQVEGDESFTATLSANSSNPLPTGFSLGTATATATIGAAGTATVSIAGPTGNVNEGDDATFTVTLSGSPGAAVVVDYATAAGTATAGSDFTATNGTLTFAAGVTGTDLTQTFTVPVLTDSLVEGSETFTATLSANSSNPLPTGFTLGTTSAQVAITAAGSATVSISGGGIVNEGENATFTVTLSASPGAAVVVDYATAAGTATEGNDFTETTGTLTFAANTTDLSQTFTVPVLTDSIVEGSESFTATLSANASNPLPTGFSLGTTSAQVAIAAAGSATVSISGGGNVNEGDDATFTVTLSGSPGAAVVVDYATATGTASATDFTDTSGTLTFAAGVTGTDLAQTFDVPVLTDAQVEGSESFTATLSANSNNALPTGFSLGTATATATITAAGSATVSISGGGNVAEGANATFTVTLTGSPGSAVLVAYAAAGDTASTDDFTATSGTLTFAAGTTNLSQTFTVPVTDDDLVEGDETFTVTLSANPANPLPTGFSLGTATATATIGAAGTATVSIAGPTGNVNEGDDATFTVTLSGSPGAAVVVDYATAIGTASATDFSDTSGTLTFAANTTTLSQTFDVPVLDDPQVEGSETFTATLSANSSNPLPTGFTLGTATATATIGAAGTATVSIAGPTGNVNEGDDATFTVTLSGSPGAAVVVDYATAIGTASATDFSDTSGTLTFAANTTTLSQTFDVPVLDDPQVEGDESFTATLSANSSNPLPTGFSLGTATATATIGAAGTATVSIAGPTGNVNEGDDATFTVTLSGSPGAAVVVDYATAIGTASATDFSDTSGTLTFAANTTTLSQTFDVPVLDDPQVEGSETFTATLSANSSNPLPTGFTLGTATATATIGAAGTATVSIAGPTGNVNEGDDATFTVTLSGSPGAAVVVDYATAIGTASATDFSDTSGTLTFAANTTTLSQTFDVPVLDDPQVEGDESFTATLSANSSNPLPTGFTLGTATATATIGAAGTATVSIAGPTGNVNEGDDATFTVTLSGSPGAAVVVDPPQ